MRALEDKVRQLETRLSCLENYVGVPTGEPGLAAEALQEVLPGGAANLESQIGELWMSRVGVVALIVGLGFLVTYPFATLPSLVPCLIGYVAVVAFFGMAQFWKKSLPDTSRLLFSGALFLLYFATLRLHFFSPHPAVGSRGVALGLLLVVLVGQGVVAYRRASQLTAAMVLVLSFVTSVVSDTPNFSLALTVVSAGVAVWYYRRLNWWQLTLVAMGLTYGFHLLWLVNNPLVGNKFHGVGDPQFNLAFLAMEGVIFALAGLLRPEAEPAFVRILRAGGNSAGAMLVGLVNVQLFHAGAAYGVFLGMAIAFLGIAIGYWQHQRGQYGTAIYACFGYMALSAAIFSWFPAPDYYGWLAWQSLLVAATAVWFRSKIIVVANVFIYGGIYVIYFIMAPANGWVNLSFALVALLIARILNWRQELLELRTEIMRNFYLAAATITIPYGLYHMVAPSLVSVAWLGAAAVYFLASLLLSNRKYRLMAMATVLATIVYVFIVDLSHLEPAYRIISFLVLGVVLLVISVFYARQRRRLREKPPEPTAP